MQGAIDGVADDLGSIVHTQVDFSGRYENGFGQCVGSAALRLYTSRENTCPVYHGGHTNGDDGNAKGFRIECAAGVAHSGTGNNTGIGYLYGTGQMGERTGSERIYNENRRRLYGFTESVHKLGGFYTGLSQYAGSGGGNRTP